MKLYHYTSIENLRAILSDNEIKTCPSNLLRPVAPKLINGTLTDETDSYKPVVWFTSLLDFDSAANYLGLAGSATDKTEAAIEIETALRPFCKWETWALKNGIDQEWFKALKKTASGWTDFYVIETPVRITEDCRIIFRPDIAEELMEGAGHGSSSDSKPQGRRR